MGSEYRIPTGEEWRELEEECNWTSGECNGIKGFYVSDKRDGTAVIFLPYVKKSSKHDITVYLSAPDYIISYIRDAQEEYDYLLMRLNSGGLTDQEFTDLRNNYIYEILGIEKRISAGEVLTENSHIYCEKNLLLSPFKTENGDYYIDNINNSEYTWTHPQTGKDYNFSDSGVLGGGVLYVRAVSNK